MSNPAATRIPDAHFFWEAKYNGTQVIAISPEFTPTAMHANFWVNPKPGTDAGAGDGHGPHPPGGDGGYKRGLHQASRPICRCWFGPTTDRFLRARPISPWAAARAIIKTTIFFVWDEAFPGRPVQGPGNRRA